MIIRFQAVFVVVFRTACDLDIEGRCDAELYADLLQRSLRVTVGGLLDCVDSAG